MKKDKSNAQKFSKEFERISIDIINFIFQDVPVKIQATDTSKDGGYDAVVEMYDNNCVKRVYFECKLRENNLNLRDIAANLIIAFNEGALALVILTNKNYTQQANENFKKFYENTTLNIKVLIGEEIKKIAQIQHINIPEELSSILHSKKTIGKTEYDVLRFDLSKTDLYSQIINKTKIEPSVSTPYVVQIFSKFFKELVEHIVKGDLVVLESPIGTGKTTFVHSAISKINAHAIYITVDVYSSQSIFLLDILLKIWGVPLSMVVQDFSDEIVDKIIGSIQETTKEYNSKTIGEVIKHILGKTTPYNVSDENFNMLICQYIVSIIKLHSENTYCFHIEGMMHATKEIQNILVYLCRLLQENKIGCIIEYDSTEYEFRNTVLRSDVQLQLYFAKYYRIELPFLKCEQTFEFVQMQLPEIPNYIQQKICQHTGGRLLTLTTVISYALKVYHETNDYTAMLNAVEQFPAHELPACIEILLNNLYNQYRKTFEYLVLWNFNIPFEFVDLVFDSDDLQCIEHLQCLGYINNSSTNIIISNLIAKDIIKSIVTNHFVSLRISAKKLQPMIFSEYQQGYYDFCINVAYYQENWETLFHLLNEQILYTKKHRLYSETIRYADLLLNLSSNISDDDILRLSTEILETLMIIKEINSQRAYDFLELFANTMKHLSETECTHYRLKYDYFQAKRLFKESHFNESLILTEKYYIHRKKVFYYEYNNWLAKICVVYALNIKEIYGNQKACSIFKELVEIFPDSTDVIREYHSHMGCINLYKNPLQALSHYCYIINMFQNNIEQNYELPFHEYGDRAMSAVCAKKYDAAKDYCEEALKITESNGVIGEAGRIYNIKGCLAICDNNYYEARRCFNEAAFLTDLNQYPLYAWRILLNQAAILSKEKDKKQSLLVTGKAYHIFKSLYAEKIKNIICDIDFYISREYLAILLFINVYKENGHDFLTQMVSDLELETIQEKIQKDLDLVENESPYYNCPYSNDGYIFMLA